MSRHRSLTTALAVLLLASPLAAQSTSRDTSVASVTPRATSVIPHAAQDSMVALSPTWAPAWTVSAGAQANASVTPVRGLLAPQHSQSSTMMIVGGAGLLVGAIVGGKPGSVLMVGGGVIGLFGLWAYLR